MAITTSSTFYDSKSGVQYAGDSYIISDILPPILYMSVPIYVYNRLSGGALETISNELFNKNYGMWDVISEQVPLWHPCEIITNTVLPMPTTAALLNKNVNSNNTVVRPI
jgi:hypothetical protein